MALQGLGFFALARKALQQVSTLLICTRVLQINVRLVYNLQHCCLSGRVLSPAAALVLLPG